MTDYTVLWREDAPLEEVVQVYQELIDSGLAWRLEGHVGRTAMRLIADGYCMLADGPHRDYYGNTVPGRDELTPGSPGTAEYVEQRNKERD